MSANTSFTIALGPDATYCATELIQRRLYRGVTHERLVKWTLLPRPSIREDADEKEGEERSEEGRLRESYNVWMRREEMEACCPRLLITSRGLEQEPARDSDGTRGREDGSEGVAREPGEAELEEDVRVLVARALSIHAAGGSSSSSSKVLTNTISVLSAYARIGTMANVFRQAGALDLLLSLLSSHHLDVRRSAGDMLRSLATFDAGSRAYVLLKLTDDGGEEGEGGGLETTVQSRQMLLDLFAETASCAEVELLFSDLNVPHVSELVAQERGGGGGVGLGMVEN